MSKPSNFPKTKRPPTIFNRIEGEAAERAARGQHVIPMHVGDTYLPMPHPLIEPAADEEREFGVMLNRYGDTAGEAPLRKLLLDKVRRRNRLPANDIDCVQVTGGATGALEPAFSRLVGAGGEILVLSPYWTILRQVAVQAGVTLVEVPFFDLLVSDKNFDPAKQLESLITGNTSGIYINTPSNPTGMVLSELLLERIAYFARKHDLWVFSDEAYEDFIYSGEPHISIGSLPGMFQRTVSVYTFSKCFGVSGLRVGYAVSPAPVTAELNRAVVGNMYQVGRLDQLMAWRGMRRYEEAMLPIRDAYADAWEWAKDSFQTHILPSESTFYFFIWLGEDWKSMTTEAKVTRMLDAGIVLSPGESFGRDYDGWARMCFTSIPPDDLCEAIDRINKLLG